MIFFLSTGRQTKISKIWKKITKYSKYPSTKSEDFNLKQKPSRIRENKTFTLDMSEIPVSSAKADDNFQKHCYKVLYVQRRRLTYIPKDQNGVWYVNIRDSKDYKRQYVPEDEIYELRREYHTSKHNPNFSRSI